MDSDAINACAALVHKGDPDRFLAAMAAPVAARGPLFVLAAFNLELARAPWVTREPLLARMRLQFWRDVVSGEGPAAHEVAAPLRALIASAALPADLLVGLIDAREGEIGTQAPFAAEAALLDYLRATAGGLLALSVLALGGPRSDAVLDLGQAQGMANYLAAVPALQAAGRQALPEATPPAIAGLARSALARLDAARPGLREVPPPARPALLAAWRARPLLKQALARPEAVLAQGLGQSEFTRRGSLVLRGSLNWLQY